MIGLAWLWYFSDGSLGCAVVVIVRNGRRSWSEDMYTVDMFVRPVYWIV